MESTHVLVVEDHEGVRHGINCLLEASGHSVVAVESAGQALEALQQEEFDVVCTDLRLPEMDGSQLLSAIRAKGVRTPVMVMSGASQQAVKQAFRGKPQPQAVISKPVAFGELIDTIESLAHSCRGSSQVARVA